MECAYIINSAAWRLVAFERAGFLALQVDPRQLLAFSAGHAVVSVLAAIAFKPEMKQERKHQLSTSSAHVSVSRDTIKWTQRHVSLVFKLGSGRPFHSYLYHELTVIGRQSAEAKHKAGVASATATSTEVIARHAYLQGTCLVV